MPLFITNPTNIRYLTGFVGVNQRDAYVLVTKEQTYIFTSAMYREAAVHLAGVHTATCQVIILSKDNPITKALLNLSIKKLEFEADNLTVSEFETLQKTGITLIPTQNKIEKLRMIKRKDEIDNIRLAANITDRCFTYITKRIRPGITEARLAWEIESYLKMNAGDIAFSPIVAFNENSSQPHYHARGNSPLRKNSLILLDFGARVNGYCADMTRVVFLGTPKPEWVKTYTQVVSANQKAIDLLINGERDGGVLDQKANIPPYPHTLGHAVGLDIHEAPRLTHKNPEKLLANMVVTIEPGMYIEGQYGIRIEDLILLKDNGLEILSKSPKKLFIL